MSIVVLGGGAVFAQSLTDSPGTNIGSPETGNNASNTAVPNAVGLDAETAVNQLNEQGFQVEVQEVSSSDTQAGVVSAQRPVRDTEVPTGSTVRLWVSNGPEGIAFTGLIIANEYGADVTVEVTRTDDDAPHYIGIRDGAQTTLASDAACAYSRMVAKTDSGEVVAERTEPCDGGTWTLRPSIDRPEAMEDLIYPYDPDSPACDELTAHPATVPGTSLLPVPDPDARHLTFNAMGTVAAWFNQSGQLPELVVYDLIDRVELAREDLGVGDVAKDPWVKILGTAVYYRTAADSNVWMRFAWEEDTYPTVYRTCG
jgi:hypothetical protein